MRHFFLMVAFGSAIFAADAHAQACGALSPAAADALLQNLGELFYSPDNVETRDTIIQQLDPATHPGAIVNDDSVCQAVAQRMVQRLRAENLRWQGAEDPEYTSAVFRFGPYYVGVLRETVPATPGALGRPTGRNLDMIFRVADLEFLLAVL